jgi:Ca2+-binding RTX toxin-like protein
MIRVKSTRASASEDPARRLGLDDVAAKSGLPQAIGAAIAAVALYLRSMMSDPFAALAAPVEDLPEPRREPAGPQLVDASDAAAGPPATPDRESDPARRAQDDAQARAPDDTTAGAPQMFFASGTVVSLFGSASVPMQPVRPVAFGVSHLPVALAGPASDVAPELPFDPLAALPEAEATATEVAARLASGDPRAANRSAPRAGTVALDDLVGTNAVLITMSGLLAGTPLAGNARARVEDMVASSGTLAVVAGGLLYTPDRDHLGPVSIGYRVSDGATTLDLVSTFDVAPTAIAGTASDDTLFGTAGGDAIEGGAGDDDIIAGAGPDLVRAGDGADQVFGGAGDDYLLGGDGDDALFGEAGNDWIFGEAGDDRMFGGTGDDRMFGGADDDLLRGGAGNDLLDGGADNDALFGDAGDDTLLGGDGGDTLDGGAGDDTLDGGAGDDILTDGRGRDSVSGGAGNDRVVVTADGDDDNFDGGEGEADTLDLSRIDAPLAVDLAVGTLTGGGVGTDRVEGFERLIAGKGDDVLHGSAGDDIVADGAGADQVDLGAGDDTLVAADDDDADTYLGGAGDDTLDFSAITEGRTIDLRTGTAGDDRFEAFEAVIGTAGDDTFIVGDVPVRLSGCDGDDSYDFGQAGEDAASAGYLRVAEIQDFGVGDSIRTRTFQLFESEGEGDERGLRLGGVEGVTSLEDGHVRLSYSNDEEGREVTWLEVDEDEVYGTVVTFNGHHVMILIDIH